MKISTTIFTLAIAASILPAKALAGDGTKANPYTVAEALSLSNTNDTIWVTGDLKGMGKDGLSQANNIDTRADSAAVLTGGGSDLTIWSYEILQGLALEDLTNTRQVLVKGLFQNNDALVGQHFSLCELHRALSLEIKNGYRGYHIQSNYVLPGKMMAVSVNAGYTAAKGATLTYSYTDGDTLAIIGKNSCRILMAPEGSYDLVLTAASSNDRAGSTSLGGGTLKGLNTVRTNNRYLYRFIATADSIGFVRNSDNQKEVTLDDRSEVWLTVNALETHFFGHYAFDDGDTRKWIKWTGKSYGDFDHAAGIGHIDGTAAPKTAAVYDLQGRRTASATRPGIYVSEGRKVVLKTR